MFEPENIRSKFTSIQNNNLHFFEFAQSVYEYQYTNNLLFQSYVDLLKKQPYTIKDISDFAFLPIELFKHEVIKSGEWQHEKCFESSSTTGQTTSKHYIRSMDRYLTQSKDEFEYLFQSLNDTVIIGLLPSYLERTNSSLVAMVDAFVKASNRKESGFYLNEYEALSELLKKLNTEHQHVIVIGVSFALLDLAELFPGNYKHIKFMETGGMKGRRAEIIRADLHQRLSAAFGVETIYSEYGMTELLSQAYMLEDGRFTPSSTMRVQISEINDPFKMIEGESGRINVIDLMNIDSCAFIQTSDLGRVYQDHSFDVLGRIDHSDIRGCNLMI